MALKGRITVDETHIVEVDADPSMDGVDAPLSSIALLDDDISGKAWIKTGPSSTDWDPLNGATPSTGFLDGGTPSSIFDSLADIDGGGV